MCKSIFPIGESVQLITNLLCDTGQDVRPPGEQRGAGSLKPPPASGVKDCDGSVSSRFRRGLASAADAATDRNRLAVQDISSMYASLLSGSAFLHRRLVTISL